MTRNFIFALAATALLCSCSKKEDKSVVEEELVNVELGVATLQDVAQNKQYTATVEADNSNNIAPASPNRIRTIAVEVGDHVRRGQTLVTLDRANMDQIKVNLDDARREYDRAKKLLEIGGGTQQAVDQQKTKLDAYRTQYENMLENTVLTSPITGIVTARNYDPGDMTGNLPVLTVGQITPIVKIMIHPTEADLTKIRRGMPVDITFDAFPGQDFSGKIGRIYPTVDPATRTFQVEVDIQNPKGEILPGMFARVNINLGNQNNIVVPDRAVVNQTGSGNKYVYVYEGGKVSFIRVELGQRLGSHYEVLSGLSDGDSIVIAGQNSLADGMAVNVLRK